MEGGGRGRKGETTVCFHDSFLVFFFWFTPSSLTHTSHEGGRETRREREREREREKEKEKGSGQNSEYLPLAFTNNYLPSGTLVLQDTNTEKGHFSLLHKQVKPERRTWIFTTFFV